MARVRFESGAREARVRDMIGRKGRTLRKIRNGFGGIAKGTVVTIVSTWRSGYGIETDFCKHCGQSNYVSQVHRDGVEVLE